MSQQEIQDILEKLGENEWISSTFLLNRLSCTRGNMIQNLKKMRNYGEIQSRKIKVIGWNYELEHRLTSRGRI